MFRTSDILFVGTNSQPKRHKPY